MSAKTCLLHHHIHSESKSSIMTSMLKSCSVRRISTIVSSSSTQIRFASTAVRPAFRANTARLVPSLSLRNVGARFMSITQRDKWANKPMITYEELKPITQQPNDVSVPLCFSISKLVIQKRALTNLDGLGYPCC